MKCGVTFTFQLQIIYVRAKVATTTINNRKCEKRTKATNTSKGKEKYLVILIWQHI